MPNFKSLSFLKFFRPASGGWYVSLIEYNTGLEPESGWCFLAMCWLPNYRRLKIFINKTA